MTLPHESAAGLFLSDPTNPSTQARAMNNQDKSQSALPDDIHAPRAQTAAAVWTLLQQTTALEIPDSNPLAACAGRPLIPVAIESIQTRRGRGRGEINPHGTARIALHRIAIGRECRARDESEGRANCGNDQAGQFVHRLRSRVQATYLESGVNGAPLPFRPFPSRRRSRHRARPVEILAPKKLGHPAPQRDGPVQTRSCLRVQVDRAPMHKVSRASPRH